MADFAALGSSILKLLIAERLKNVAVGVSPRETLIYDL